MKSIKFFLILSLVLSTSFAMAMEKCRVGGTDTLSADATGIMSGTKLVSLEKGTAVRFESIPNGAFPNYQVSVTSESDAILVGSSTRFVGCESKICTVGEVVTIDDNVTGIANGMTVVTIKRGSQVVIKEVPAGFSVNYKIAEVEQSESILLGSTTSFDTCR